MFVDPCFSVFLFFSFFRFQWVVEKNLVSIAKIGRLDAAQLLCEKVLETLGKREREGKLLDFRCSL